MKTFVLDDGLEYEMIAINTPTFVTLEILPSPFWLIGTNGKENQYRGIILPESNQRYGAKSIRREDKKEVIRSKNYEGISSQVNMTSYNEDKMAMTVVFKNGATWNYSPVPLAVWEDSLKAESIGKFLNSVIKPKYTATKLN